MSPVLEEIIEKIRRLPPEQRKKLIEILDREDEEEIEKERQRRIELTKSIKGKYRDSLPNPELRTQWKAEEIEMEDKGWQPK